ncbi:lysyl-tRNA synthetase [Gaeumannomyces tritici R3-111a-1]|uniref:Lysyl-tRNA synthetase n=1 Tax=Gaeumannomyces tritici (strain R3-111a-1) TaxID=644352 RepID=J3NRU2_GAET3|nr:lysyl-tRNA synthetase [Gaeumannomyces tritici R3-111a-1]EJT78898.1 lysyl-tRNA synthetase [Gaeumannomyces tritici R3-111a-1]
MAASMNIPAGLGLQFLRPCAQRSAVGPVRSAAVAQLQLRFYYASRSLRSQSQDGRPAVPIGEMAGDRTRQQKPSQTAITAGVPGLLDQHHRENNVVGRPRIIRGRIDAVRRHGRKLLFIDVVSGFETMQVLVNYGVISTEDDRWRDISSDSEGWAAATGALRRGAFISVVGDMALSRDNKLSIKARKMPVILGAPSPGFDPPEVLVDEEVTARHRHLDLLANRQMLDTLRLRSAAITSLRSFLDGHQFIEVQTPILAAHAGGASARPFSTRSADMGIDQPLALRVAPELWLKRLAVGGFERVFEIGPCFRNEGLDSTHNPEFTMCEFYEAYASLDTLILRTENLMAKILKDVQFAASGNAGALRAWQLQGDLEAVAAKFKPGAEDGGTGGLRRVAFIPTLEKALGFKLPGLDAETAFEDLIALLRKHELEPKYGSSATTLPKLLDRLGSDYVESESCTAKAIFVTHHPACMAPLARSTRCAATGQVVALRAELFVDGVELANMYEEENDPDEQERKFKEQACLLRQQQRGKMQRSFDHQVASHTAVDAGLETADMDEAEAEAEASGALLTGSDANYVRALRAGLPPTGGWGCGIERLVMVLSGAPRIRDVLSFGNLRNVVSVSRPENQDLATSSSA